MADKDGWHDDLVDFFGHLWLDRVRIPRLRQEAAKADSVGRWPVSLCISLFHTQSLCHGHRRHDFNDHALAAQRAVRLTFSTLGRGNGLAGMGDFRNFGCK